jgi:hypothetical protein
MEQRTLKPRKAWAGTQAKQESVAQGRSTAGIAIFVRVSA